MVTDSSDSSMLADNAKHFLVKRRDGTIFLVAEVERYKEGDDDYGDASQVFDDGYGSRPAQATPVKRRSTGPSAEGAAETQSARFGGGAITLHFQAGD